MKLNPFVKYWLIAGLIMLFVQIILGGITRLTGSGLSITRWEIVTGTIPPLNENQWKEEFELYRSTPQYEKITRGLALSEFKVIYFWEYVHRLWARLMGFAFIIPFVFFWRKRLLNSALIKDLFIVVLLAAIAALFGWIMVASGLIDRPWVNAYKLSVHLGLGISVMAYLYWTYLKNYSVVIRDNSSIFLHKYSCILTAIVSVQILAGGLMSGMKAALVYPTWPKIGDHIIPQEVININEWSVDKLIDYEFYTLAPTLAHFLHRNIAYLLVITSLYFMYYFNKKYKPIRQSKAALLFITLLIIQIILGITTLVSSKGGIPVIWGVLHQGMALFLFGSSIYLNYLLRPQGMKFE